MLEKKTANILDGIKCSSILTETFLGCIAKGFGENTLGCFGLVRKIHVQCNSWMTVSQERFHGCWASPKSDIGREAGVGSWSKWPSSWQTLQSAPGGDFLPDPEGPVGASAVGLGRLFWLHLLRLPGLWVINVVNDLPGVLVPTQQK